MPRLVNGALGLWLLTSAFLWPHGVAQRINTAVVGALIAATAAAAVFVPRARWFNVPLALWLFVSVWLLPTLLPLTVWHNVLVSWAVFLLALAPGLRPVVPSAQRRGRWHAAPQEGR